MNPRQAQPPVAPGRPAPLGATAYPDGTNFSVYSPEAEAVALLLFARADAPRPSRVIRLDRAQHCTTGYWHAWIPGVGHGQIYAWRAYGPDDPARGLRFDGDKVLLDPYGRAVVNTRRYDRRAAMEAGDNCAKALRNAVVDPARFDWEGDLPLGPPTDRPFIYEMHASGFTKAPSSGLSARLRGTYAGVIEKIPYLQELGVNIVELLPVQHYERQDAPKGRTNFWGYSTQAFFAPHAFYSSDRSATGPVDEFREMVKHLHRAGIRVVLDVVYNHTAEGGVGGPTLSLRGLANDVYYLLDPDKSRYADFTGCGNTLNANHPVTRRFILDSLRYWVEEMHVDGFRFDLASAMTRGADGAPLARPPLFEVIEADPTFADTILIAEAWDARGLYQVGHFPAPRFAQWNGPFRDTARRFFKGDEGTIEALMARIVGSPDIFRDPAHRPSHSVNFITCHDGFTLNDLVSYSRKHNRANGEENRDGSNDNHSCNHGVEGATTDPEIEALRARQIRNMLALLFLSHGAPMMLMGDEVRQSRRGNNNPWCQDNTLNWLDWTLVEANADLLRFTRELAAFARQAPIFVEDRFWAASNPERAGDITWHGVETYSPDWGPHSRRLAYTLRHPESETALHVILNADPSAITFAVPPPPKGQRWTQLIDTARPSPEDLHRPEEAPLVDLEALPVEGKSVVALWARPAEETP